MSKLAKGKTRHLPRLDYNQNDTFNFFKKKWPQIEFSEEIPYENTENRVAELPDFKTSGENVPDSLAAPFFTNRRYCIVFAKSLATPLNTLGWSTLVKRRLF